MWIAIGKVHSRCSLYAEVQSIRCTTRTPWPPLHTVQHALTFVVFVDQQPSAKASSHENLDQPVPGRQAFKKMLGCPCFPGKSIESYVQVLRPQSPYIYGHGRAAILRPLRTHALRICAMVQGQRTVAISVACMAEALRQGLGYEFRRRVVVLFLQSLHSSFVVGELGQVIYTPACITLTDIGSYVCPSVLNLQWQSVHCFGEQ